MKELPTFKEGMCYVLELKDSYILSQSLSLTVEKNEDIKMDYVKWTMTSDHDYLGVTTNRKLADAMPHCYKEYSPLQCLGTKVRRFRTLAAL